MAGGYVSVMIRELSLPKTLASTILGVPYIGCFGYHFDYIDLLILFVYHSRCIIGGATC